MNDPLRPLRESAAPGDEPLEADSGVTNRVDVTDSRAVRNALLARGWRQGSFLPRVLSPYIAMIPYATADPTAPSNRAILLSQDCDAVYGNCAAEPAVEVVVATPIEATDPNRLKLRDPRMLHTELELADGSKQPVAIGIWARGFLDRKRLIECDPEAGVSISAKDLGNLAAFAARRYVRDSFPDSFDRRFEKGYRAIARLVRENASAIVDVYLSVKPFEELDSDKSYEVYVYVLVEDEIANGDAKAFNVFKQDVKSALFKQRGQLESKNVHIEDIIVEGLDQFTLRRMLETRRVDLDPLRADMD